MAGVIVAMAIVVFVAGVLTGVMAALAVAARRGDAMYPLAGIASSRLGTYARRLNGLGHRDLNIPPGGPLSH
jgi:hypothetical protein